MDNLPHDSLGGDPYLFDVDMYRFIYDSDSYLDMPDIRSICYEYSDVVEVIPSGKDFVYSVVIKAKYFSDIYSRMKSHGYCSCFASPSGEGAYHVKFSKNYDDHIRGMEG